MSNTVTERKDCTINDLATLVGRIESLTMGSAEADIVRRAIDRAADASKRTFHARNDRIALVQQVKSNPMQWGVA